MNIATIKVEGTCAKIVDRIPTITAGLVGATIIFAFAPEWDAYTKAAVFRYQKREKIVTCIEDVVTIPSEMLSESGEKLLVGVYGVRLDGQGATPTSWVTLGRVQPGSTGVNDPGANPELPVWAQLMAMIEKLGDLKNANGIPAGGAAGEYLVKQSDDDYDVAWSSGVVPEQYGLVTYNQDKTITIT